MIPFGCHFTILPQKYTKKCEFIFIISLYCGNYRKAMKTSDTSSALRSYFYRQYMYRKSYEYRYGTGLPIIPW